MKKLVFAIALLVGTGAFAQTVEELKAKKAEKSAEAAKFQGEADALQAQIDALPGWKYSAFGTIGANFSGFNNWYSNAAANSNSANIGISVTGTANLTEAKYFWKNTASANLGWLKFDGNTKADTSAPGYVAPEFDVTTDVFNISSLFGYKLNDKFAASALMEYRTSIIKNFNNPGYLDFGVGATWTPIADLVVVIHPLNYNYVFAKEGATFDSSLGAKIVADYNKTIGKFKFRSNFSTFQSYSSSDLSNWTWVNSLGFNIWKGIGVGLESGLRQNKQESFNVNPAKWGNDLSKSDNKTQSYWLAGLSYSL